MQKNELAYLSIAALVIAAIIAVCVKWPVFAATPFVLYLAAFAILMIIGPPFLYLFGLFWILRKLDDVLFDRWGIHIKWDFPHNGKVYYSILLTAHIILIWQSPLYCLFLSQDSGAPQHYVPE